ncbi:MAG: hypothetical protein E7291_07850 [Lachnospiraceae bacterium]|nr:hypothetical protein [Lachnospiraceae bacterium]
MDRMYRWQFHFNAMHNMTPETDENKHTHSFLVILCMIIEQMDLEKQNCCEKELKQYLEQYNGRYLNAMEKFQGNIPTIELICETVYYDVKEIATIHGMQLIQVEVGDSPTALYAMGERLLLGSSYIPIKDEMFREYKRQMDL